jgi:Transposase IS200 like
VTAWVFEAKKRFGLSVLNYAVTSNHVHLLVRYSGANVIPQSLQLIAGRTAQGYRFSTSQRSERDELIYRVPVLNRKFGGVALLCPPQYRGNPTHDKPRPLRSPQLLRIDPAS